MEQVRKKVLIFGAGGRVGLYLSEALLRNGVDVVAIDFLPQEELDSRISRVIIDSRVSGFKHIGLATIYGNVNVLDEGKWECDLQKKELSHQEQIDACGKYTKSEMFI